MIVTHRLKIDLVKWGLSPNIDVMQDDKYSRNLEITLLEDGRPFDLPDDCSVMIRYRKADHIGGAYDTLPDGTPAGHVTGSVVTVALAPQVCTTAGTVHLVVTLLSGTAELTSFALQLSVHKLPIGVKPSREYIKITSFVPQTEHAEVGQYLKVKAVDTSGRVTALESETIDGSDGFENMVTCDLEGSTEDNTAVLVNADTLGGKLPETYENDGCKSVKVVTNGIEINWTQIGKLVFVCWNGTSESVMANGVFYDMATDLPERVGVQPWVNVLTTPNKYFYNAAVSGTTLRFRPIGANIPASSEAYRGQLVYISATRLKESDLEVTE